MSGNPQISEWGNPAGKTPAIHAPIHNAWKGTRGTETSKYPEEEKEKRTEVLVDSRSSGERKGKSLNRGASAPG